MKQAALEGVEAYNGGATATDLAVFLRDVISEGRRHA